MQQKANEDFLSEIFSEDLKIKVEEKIEENKNFYFISGIGNLNFKDKDFKLIEKVASIYNYNPHYGCVDIPS